MLETCTARSDAILADAERLMACESPSDDLEAIARSADVVADVVGARLGEVGLPSTPERIVIDGCTHLRWRFGGGGRVVILTHHDTVWPLGSLESHPISITDGVLSGPGCFDMKVGLAQGVHAIAALAEVGGPQAVDGVTLLVTGDEEIGSHTSRELIEDEVRGAKAVLVLEAAGQDGSLKTARKGISMYKVEAFGRASHAGLEPEKGINSAIEIASQIPVIAALADDGLGTTVTPTRLRVDTTVNTVPPHAVLDVDVRAMTPVEQRRVDHAMRSLVPFVSGSRIVVSGGVNRPVMDRAHTAHLFARATLLADAAGIHPLHAVAVGGASDGNLAAGVGVPTLDGLGAVGGGAHADNEHVLIEHIPHRTALVALLIGDSLAGGGT
ncbi:MAG: M20 family metallopeptidase [Demequinaceae bacterium]|nr:M20 family metallopeptidase [Demequinaceae bacterium]